MLAVGEGGDKMNKIAALLLTILFALSVMGCATTQDKDTLYQQLDDIRKQEAQSKKGLMGP